MELSLDEKIALEAARLFLSKTDKIDVDEKDFRPNIRDSIVSMWNEADYIIKELDQ